MSTKRTIACLLLTLLCTAPLAADPLDTAFTYQGQLKTSGAAAAGLHDLQFRLYDAEAGGSIVGSAICLDNVNVSDGLFNVKLDFGTAFAGQKRYLEIDVRPDTGLPCANPSGYTTLLPRQELTAAPNASFSQNTRGVNVDASGKVGIGTNAPDAPLRLVGANTAGNAGLYASAGTGLDDQSKTILGENSSSYGIGLQGRALATTGTNYGVWGESLSPTGIGVIGFHRATSGDGTGVLGASNSPDGWAGYFNGRVLVTSNVGLNTITPGFPLSFNDSLGDKISLYGQSGSHYGLGIQPGLMQIHTIGASDDIAFGYGSSANFTERMRVKGNGNVGIGTSSPTAKLDVNGAAKVGSLQAASLQVVSGAAAGRVLTSDATGNASWQTPTPPTPPALSNFVEFTSSGNQLWTVPAGVTSVVVQVWGAGGSGGGGGQTLHGPLGSYLDGGGGGGGGSGAYSRAQLNVSPGTQLKVTVGNGGAGVSQQQNGAAGANSVIQNYPQLAILVAAAGGSGGAAGFNGGGGGGSGGGGAGGGAIQYLSQVAFAGNAGAAGSGGNANPGSGGGGGASASTGVVPTPGFQSALTLPSGLLISPNAGALSVTAGRGALGGGTEAGSAAGGTGYVLIGW